MNDIDCVKRAIYDIENELIQQKIFQDNSGRPRFITNLEIKSRTSLQPECAHLDDTQIENAIATLDPNEFIVFNNNLGDIDQNLDIKFFIRSRIYHTIWVLYRSTNRTQGNIEQNVSDFQYVRHIKNRPKNNIELREVLRDPSVGIILNESKNPWLDKVIAAIIKETKYKKISQFQLKSAITILKDLDMCQKHRDSKGKSVPKGIVIEAGTGFGKSFAYQLPLLLWTLNKKINIIEDYQKKKIKLGDLHVNCSALLIFPRNALAQDQYDNLNQLITIINNVTSKSTDLVEREVLHIKPPIRDFQSNISSELDKKYGRPDIIITGPKSLERRLVNPKCAPVYKNGIDCVLYDEVHLWDGIEGAEVASLNGRLQNLFQEKAKKSPLFVGMSATIAKAETHCQKLFALMMGDKPKHITQAEEDSMEAFAIEHHLILKPRSGRSPLGVAIDTTSSLIHNRRNGLQLSHDDMHGNKSYVDKRQKDKTLTFIDSLNLTGKFANKLNNFEMFYDGHARKAKTPRSPRPHRGYLFHWRPESRPGPGVLAANFNPAHDCASCIDKTSPEIFGCPSYARGECWYYSLDSGGQDQTPIYGNWQPKATANRLTVPIDNIRSNKVTSLDRKPSKGFTKYDYFAFTGDDDWPAGKIWIPGQGGGQYITPFYTDIDNVVATSKLEVGVDFDNIKEIIQYGEIRSPSSYKQKAGRGAREGNTVDGLFVMTVITDSALAYHHFKHFRRLVESSLDPLKLEPANPDVLKSNCYFSILEFLALNDVNLFTISKMRSNDVTQEFIKAMNLLADPKLEKYLERFLNIFNQSDPKLIKEIIEDTKSFLDILSTEKEITIGGTKNKKTLQQWLIESVTDAEINNETREQYGINANTVKGNATNAILNSIQKLKDVYQEKFPGDTELAKLLDDYEKE